jgi:hypothetical protein
MKSCKKFQKKLPLYVYNELAGLELAELEAHLQVCAACRVRLEAVRATLGFIPPQPDFEPPAELLPAFRNLLSQRLRTARPPFARFTFFHARPVFQLGFATLLVLLGFFLGRWQTMPKSANGNALLQQLLAASQPIHFSNGQLSPFLGQIERIRMQPETGLIEIEYQTVNDVAVRGNLENAAIQQLLQQALQEESNQAVRLHAVKALGGLTTAPLNLNVEIIDALIGLLKKEENAGVRLQILRVLKSIPFDEKIKNILVQILLYDKNEALRIEAFKALTTGKLDLPEQESLLRKARLDSNSFIQYQSEEKLDQILRQNRQIPEISYLKKGV